MIAGVRSGAEAYGGERAAERRSAGPGWRSFIVLLGNILASLEQRLWWHGPCRSYPAAEHVAAPDTSRWDMNGRFGFSGCWDGHFVAGVCGILLLTAGLLLTTAGPAAAQTGGEGLESYLDRTDELLTWATDLVAGTASDQARRILEQSRQLQQRSRDLAARGRRLEAFSLGRRARDAMWHAVRLGREAAGLDERIRLRAERFADQHAQLTERARESGLPRAIELLDQAREQARRANERTVQGDLQLAWKLLEKADDLLRLAARLLADGAGPERLRQELERTGALLDDAGARLSGPDVPAGTLALLAEAREALTRAGSAAAAGDPGLALQMSALARRQALRALAQEAEDPDAAAVQRLLERFDDRAAELAERMRASGGEPERRAFERARQERDAAARALREGKVNGALRHVRSAHDLLDLVGRGLR